MVYDTQDCWVLGLSPSSGILKNNKEHNVSDALPSSGEGVEGIYSVGSVRKR
jgi:hypothetical protein